MRLPTQLTALQSQLSGLKGLNLNLNLGRRGGSVVGLDIQPGLIAAVQARANGSLVIEKAVAMPLAPDMLRDGEVNDDDALADALREMFKDSGLSKHVRVGIANQRTVLRTLELPPVTDTKELAAAVTFQAQEQVPMPLNNAVLDFHPLGVIDTPAGPRQRVVLVAAQRDMVERLLAAIDRAGLVAEGVDLSAFALIRSLYAPDPEVSAEQGQRVMYLNVDGLTNLAIAEGPLCRFTRVVGGGIEAMAAELAAKREITVQQARALLLDAKFAEPQPLEDWTPTEEPAHSEQELAEQHPGEAGEPHGGDGEELPAPPQGAPAGEFAAPGEAADAGEPDSAGDVPASARYDDESGERTGAGDPGAGDERPFEEGYGIDGDYGDGDRADEDVWGVLEGGIRDIYGEVRNSLDFHRSQEGGGEVSHVVLSGCAQDIPGFADALQSALGVEVKSREVRVLAGPLGGVSAHRLAVAAGLAIEELGQ